jgi:DNA polymerase-3 subunit gamma/tau
LHVELILIKLCYLQQAIELVRDENGISKNKGFVPIEESGAKFIIETDTKNITTRAVADNTRVATNGIKVGALEKIRKEVASRHQLTQTVAKQLNEEELYVAWGLYIDTLREKNNHSAVTNFKTAELKIASENLIEIITDSKIHQSFIENERAALIEHLQNHFSNRQLSYKIIIVENENKKPAAEEHLSTKQQYLKMIEEYPLVKELKDRLKMELDY